MEKENTVDEFFEGLPKEDKEQADIFDEKPVVKDEQPHKNRRHRRLEEQLQAEREARLIAEAKVQAVSEVNKFKAEASSEDNTPEKWLRIYGDTPESRQAWSIYAETLNDYMSKAKDEAVKEIESRQLNAQKQEKEFESFIDTELEAIEDQYNVDVTSDAPAARKSRREFLEMVQQLSPKDEEGKLKAYADFGAAWQQYQLLKDKGASSTERQKDLAARSMEKGGSSAPQGTQPTSGFRGWMKDFNITN